MAVFRKSCCCVVLTLLLVFRLFILVELARYTFRFLLIAAFLLVYQMQAVATPVPASEDSYSCSCSRRSLIIKKEISSYIVRIMWRHTGQKTIMLRLAILLACVHQIVGPPMTNKTANRTVADHPDNMEKPDDNMDVKFELEYNRYLKEVVDVLESDPEFRKKLETADENDFRSGKVAAELDFVSHHVRTQLDELKRSELARLRELMKLEEERKKAANDPHHNTHLDHSNPHTFEVQDLQMLMNKVRKDLEDADKQRREEFKEYEMMKEYESEEKMKEMDEQHKKEYLKKVEEEKKAAAKHDPVRPVHHPGSQAQLEEVWEKADHMSQKFNPKAFFYLHDLDGNGYWDEQEVNALFLKELDKIYSYQPNGHIDMRRREEEMERMREHVFTEMDANRDRFISYEEFYEQTKKDEWHRDDGWEDINAKPQFTEQEYQQFLARHQAEMENLRRQGIHPPPGYQHPIGVHPNAIPQYQQVQHPQQQYQGHPQQQYQGHPQQQYQAHPQQQYQAHPGAVPQQYQAHPGAAQQQYQAHQGVPQQHYQAQPVGQFNPPPPAGHQVPQAGHQAPPAGQQYQPPPAAGHQAPPAGQQQQYQAAPAGQQQYQAAPAGQQQQYQAAPAGQQQYQAAPAGQQQQYQAAPAGQQQQYQPPPPAQFQPLPPGSQSPPDHGQPLSNELPQQAHNPGSPQTHNAAAPANLPNSIPVKIKSTEVPK
ncbi:Nucleobindin [Nesidiocoris tenuis]|uniref:Nucleobindin n=1 Tax=Nesidiocoris tenuis TaxID=355587 RepID=A0ABN7B5Y4_9HEMI|nr:Nucleobindin [Nesidiocoris tenuis]